ncbi:MAG: GNAT family protein [Moraxellaceae bacterium]|nr:GNAT family protein [Moraxellaceae bacterium]
MQLIPITEDVLQQPAVFRSSFLRRLCEATLALQRGTGASAPWLGYLAEEGGEVVGSCTFKGPPAEGRVEIAFVTFDGNTGGGLATRMAQELIAMARRELPGIEVIARTLPQAGPSTRILQKLGFRQETTEVFARQGTSWEWVLPAAEVQKNSVSAPVKP